jgi:hypothetical protein
MHYEIQRIELWPVVKIAFFVCAILGFFPGIAVSLLLWALSNAMGTFLPGEVGDLSDFPPAMLMLGAILAPIYGAIGAGVAGIAAALYNLLARWIGGLELRLKSVQEEAGPVIEPAQEGAPV